MKKVISTVLALLSVFLAVPVQGDSYPVGKVSATIFKNYNVATDGFTYGVFGDANSVVAPVNGDGVSGALGPGTPRPVKVQSDGGGDIIAVTIGDGPFLNNDIFAAGDLIQFTYVSQDSVGLGQLVQYEGVITTWTDEDTVTASPVVTTPATGQTFRYKKFRSGTGASDAGFNVEGFDTFSIQFVVTTIAATSLDAVLECRNSKFAPFVAHQALSNFTAAGTVIVEVNNRLKNYESCRVGWAFNTDAGDQSVSTYFKGTK